MSLSYENYGEVNYYQPSSTQDLNFGIENNNITAKKEFLDNFIHLLENEPLIPLSSDSKASLAFMIEALGQLDSSTWEVKIQKIIDTLKEETQDKKNPAEATAYLYDVINHLYTQVLMIRAEYANAESNPEEAKVLQKIFEQNERLGKFKEAIKNIHKPLTLGGIHDSFIPHWFKKL